MGFERGDGEQERRQDDFWGQRTAKICKAPQNKGGGAGTADDDDRRPADILITGEHGGDQRQPLSPYCRCERVIVLSLDAILHTTS